MENKNIIQAINKAILEMPAIGKDSKNPQGWNFRSIDAIVDFSRKIIASNGLVIIPETLNASSKVDLIDKKGYISRLTTSSVLVKYNIYHTSGESLVAILPGESQDYADKSLSQAETFAFKSMLSKVFLLGFEEDADSKHTDTTTEKANTNGNPKLNIVQEHFESLPTDVAYQERVAETINWILKNDKITVKNAAFDMLLSIWKNQKPNYDKKNLSEKWETINKFILQEIK